MANRTRAIDGGAEVKRRLSQRTRLLVALLALSVALLATAYLSVASGMVTIDLQALWSGFSTASSRQVDDLVWQVRLPRFLVAALAGASLAVAGSVLQASLANPLADPGLLGIAPGASLALAITIVCALPVGTYGLPFVALAGGLLMGVLVLVMTRLTRGPVQLILLGAAISALIAAVTTIVTLLGTPSDLQLLTFLLSGSLTGKGWMDLQAMLPFVAPGLLLATTLPRRLNALQLGDSVATGLGIDVMGSRIVAFSAAILLVAPVVAACGPIGFVALLAPHMARAALRSANTMLVMPCAAMIGAVLLSAGDLTAREFVKPAELPVGLMTTVLGVPVALWLLRRSGRTTR